MNAERGFSFKYNGPLDMRMNTSTGLTATEWLQSISEVELADVLWRYGEERFSRRIAKAIIAARGSIKTTQELAQIIAASMPVHPHDKHPATRSFQAIRIAVNNELQILEASLQQALNALKIGGRLCVISFHSLEDRIVKQFMQRQMHPPQLPRAMAIKSNAFVARLQIVGRKIKPSLSEIQHNPRARSAILRVAEKLS
jgi:16S rRNA (cytosine1402-N4)-methyltransferase